MNGDSFLIKTIINTICALVIVTIIDFSVKDICNAWVTCNLENNKTHRMYIDKNIEYMDDLFKTK